ncbi:MAG: ECF transporter S component [Clostridiales bacterium]|jgi:uncharacterized membrane protein|nr:ECF transporter S component [Clostridiales bacterium]
MQKLSKTKQTAILGMFAAIIFLLTFTQIGYIKLPFLPINATIIHIPVIIGSIILGWKMGAVLGLMFGISSFINNSFYTIGLTAFVFTPVIPVPGSDTGSLLSLIVCFVPRLLVGIVPYFVYTALKKVGGGKGNAVWLTIAGIAGSLTNTLLVMHFIFIFFKDSYSAAREVAAEAIYGVILATITANGIPEAIIAGIITAAVCQTVFLVLKN